MTASRSAVLRRIAVVADDLTGAADAAAPFASRGARVSVPLAGDPDVGVDLLALVSDSRWQSAAEAAGQVTRLVAMARDWGAEMLFVKVDSTLRGNVRAEVDAALGAWGSNRALGTPAFPAQGRQVKDGVLVVHGEAHNGRVSDSFPAEVTILDAATEHDVDRVAARVLAEGTVAIGSAGLARSMARLLVPVPSGAAPTPREVTGVIVVVGSPHPTSVAQAELLAGTCGCRLTVGDGPRPDLGDATATLRHGGRVLLTTAAADGPEQESAEAHCLATELGDVVRTLCDTAQSAALVLTGGATALAVAGALGARQLRLLRETRPGVVLGELELPERSIPTITKSGGFGAPEALLEAVTTLEARA